MMSAKQSIFEKLRTANTPFLKARRVEHHLAMSPLDDRSDNLKKVFIQAAEGLSCKVYNIQNAETVPEILASILKGEKSVSAWSWDQIPYAELEQNLKAMDVQIADPLDPSVNVGITGANAALAASGSLVLNRGKDRSNGPSLLPPVHIAFVREDRILPNFEAWVAQQRVDDLNNFQRSGNILIISGPSRTADIAMQLILGMHGPKELHILLLPD
jgi:L-lactate dehydrogenase complex protein LldG